MQKFKNSFLFGAIILVVCNLISKIIGAVYRIPLLNILGSEGLGLYQMIFPIFALLLVISSSGTNVAISKFVSRENARYNKYNVKKYLFAGFIISFSISTFFTLLLFLITPLLSKYQGNSSLAICYYAILPAITLSSMLSTFKGYFLGKRCMLYTGGLQVAEQVLKLIFSLFFATKFASKGIVYAVFGTVLGVTISEVLTLTIAFVVYLKSNHKAFVKSLIKKQVVLKKSKQTKFDILKPQNSRNISLNYAIKKLFSFGFFVSLESCIMPLLGAIDSLTIVPLLIKSGLNNVVAYTLFGLEDGIVASLVSMPTVFATSFGQSIIPNIKSKNIKNSSKNVAESFKIVWLIGIACAFVFMFFAKDIINFLYAGGLSNKIVYEYSIVQDLLKLNSFNIIYLSLLNLSSSILQGLEDSKTPVVNMGICAIVRIAVVLITVSSKSVNIYGTAIADMIFYSLVFVLNMRAIKKRLDIKFAVPKLCVFPLLSAVAMCLTMKLFNIVLSGLLSPRLITLVMGTAGIAIYFALLIFTKVIDIKGISNLIFKKRQNKTVNN